MIVMSSALAMEVSIIISDVCSRTSGVSKSKKKMCVQCLVPFKAKEEQVVDAVGQQCDLDVRSRF